MSAEYTLIDHTVSSRLTQRERTTVHAANLDRILRSSAKMSNYHRRLLEDARDHLRHLSTAHNR